MESNLSLLYFMPEPKVLRQIGTGIIWYGLWDIYLRLIEYKFQEFCSTKDLKMIWIAMRASFGIK